MFKRLAETGTAVAITVDGKRVAARAGDTVAAGSRLDGDPPGPKCERRAEPGDGPEAADDIEHLRQQQDAVVAGHRVGTARRPVSPAARWA